MAVEPVTGHRNRLAVPVSIRELCLPLLNVGYAPAVERHPVIIDRDRREPLLVGGVPRGRLDESTMPEGALRK